MVQPKQPPISFRPPPALLAQIDTIATERGIKRHAAILWLLAQGITHERGMTPEVVRGIAEALAKVPASKAETMTEVVAVERGEAPGAGSAARSYAYWSQELVDKASEPKFRGVTATGEALPERGAYQKGTKK